MLKKNRHKPSQIVTTSLRIDPQLLTQFREVLPESTSTNEAIVGTIKSFVAEHRENIAKSLRREVDIRQLAQIFARNLSDVLLRDPSWAYDIIRSTRQNWPGGLLEERMTHNAVEKDFLGRTFAAWLRRRLEICLASESVTLFVDAGSTNLYVFRYLWDELAALSKQSRETCVTVVTNNEPVAEAYAYRKQDGKFAEETKVECRLLGGVVEPQYGAIVGEWAEDRLRRISDQYRKNIRYIVLAAGNFVRLSQGRSSFTCPIPLVRGDKQKTIKDLYISLADEAYLVAPLSKLLLPLTAEINKAMNFSSEAKDPKRLPYAEVSVNETLNPIRLVTTLRKGDSCLLSRHSIAVKSRIDLEEYLEPDNLPNPATRFKDLRHIGYLFEEHVTGKTIDDQIPIELPHPRTQSETFREVMYSQT